MAVAVTNLTSLRAISAETKQLKFVEETEAWYWADPTATGEDDGRNIIQPTAGTGRWVINASSTSATGFNPVLQTTAAGSYAATSKDQVFCNVATDAIFTVNLPASPTFGMHVQVNKLNANGWSRRVVIGRNGSKINSTTLDYALTIIDTQATFTYIDSTIGWRCLDTSIVSNSSLVNLSYTTDGDAGLIRYLGTNKSTVAFAEPQALNRIRCRRSVIGSPPTDQLPVALTNNNTGDSGAMYSATTFSHQLWLFDLCPDGVNREFRLERFSLRTPTSTTGLATGGIKSFSVYGARIFGTSLQAADPKLILERANFERIADVVDSAAFPVTANTWGHWTFSTSKLYDVYMFKFWYFNNNDYIPGATPSLSEIELYGDIFWP